MTRSGPLSHIRVLDLSRVIAGPWAGQMLADLGADVIKVERPGAGDDTRAWGPPFLKDRDGKETKDAAYYLAVNRGKRSITIDLDSEKGQEIVRQLAARADIVLENFKVGTLGRFGLDYEGLSKVNPKLIYCSITGFGQTGPRRDEAAYDFAIQAMGGLMSVTGEADGRPGGGPQKVGVPIVDLMTGMYATIATLAALANRERTGQGDYIDLAMLDVQVSFLLNQAMNYLVSGKSPRRTGNYHPNLQPQDVFECSDGRMVIAVGNDFQFGKLCNVIGMPEWATDALCATNKARLVNKDKFDPMLRAVIARLSAGELAAKLTKAGVPNGQINEIPAVFDEPQVKHRRMVRDLPHPAGSTPQVVNPINFRRSALQFDRAPPTLGQHTHEILGEIGWKDS